MGYREAISPKPSLKCNICFYYFSHDHGIMELAKPRLGNCNCSDIYIKEIIV